jgi:hypothetical protein
MSLAMYASPYDSNEPNEPKEKNVHAKTQKNVSEKVNVALQSINEDTLADFEEVAIEEIKQNNKPRSLTNYHKNLIPYAKEVSYELPYEKEPKERDLLDKLNYIIGLLENQQDEKTNNVVEDLLIYSLLGCFIIFIIDKFVSVGKYVRD